MARIQGNVDRRLPLAALSHSGMNTLTLTRTTPRKVAPEPRVYTFDHVFPATSANHDVS